jgi:hypothetical protein
MPTSIKTIGTGHAMVLLWTSNRPKTSRKGLLISFGAAFVAMSHL